jgi:hypothetical protein
MQGMGFKVLRFDDDIIASYKKDDFKTAVDGTKK